MDNNPFRGNPNVSKHQQNIEDWGKTKFKPTKFSSRGFGNFTGIRGGRGGRDGRGGTKNTFHNQKNKETSKFNQVDRDAKPENSTPWNKFKDEIVFKQRDEEQAAQQANMDSEEGQKILKQREINYRKLLIEQKKQEPTQWDDFGEEEKNKKNKNHSFTHEENNVNCDPKHKFAKNQKSKHKFKKTNSSNVALKTGVKEFISKELLDNFDSKKLSFNQNNLMRRVITKTAVLARGNTLKQTINEMQNKKNKIKKK